MKRKAILLLTAIMLVLGNVMMNVFAYNTSSQDYIGHKYNNSSQDKTAYIHLTPSGGVAKAQIRDYDGNVLASQVYPVYPPNTHNTEATCSGYTSCYFYVLSVDGNQAWGSQSWGLR